MVQCKMPGVCICKLSFAPSQINADTGSYFVLVSHHISQHFNNVYISDLLIHRCHVTFHYDTMKLSIHYYLYVIED